MIKTESRKMMKKIQAFAQNVIAIEFWSSCVGLVALGLISGTLVVACGASTPPEPTTAASAASRGSATGQGEALAAEENDDNDPDEADKENEPGTEEFGLSEEELVAKVEAVEALIATCMSEAGFEYVPVDFATVKAAMEAVEEPPGSSEGEYKAEYGYAISIERPAAESPATIGLGEQNLQIFNSLPEADQEAYNHALFGENTDETFAVALDAEDFADTGGCTRAAVEQIFDSEQLTAAYVNPKDTRIERDPRMIAAIKEWASCMREAGFDYNNPEEIESDIEDRLDALLDGADPENLSAEGQAALAELQGEERAIAVADHECETEFINSVERQIETELFGAPEN
jgi:hypothetical protein